MATSTSNPSRCIRSEVVSWPPGLFTEEHGADVCFALIHPVLVLPGSHEFMEVACAQFLSVFLQVYEQLLSSFEQGLAGLESGGHTTCVLIHDLLETMHELVRHDVVRVYCRFRCLLAVCIIVLDRCNDLL